MRGSIWPAVERQVEDALGERFGNRGLTWGAGLVFQNACQSLGGVTLTPATYFPTVHPCALRDLLILQTLRGQEHNAGAIPGTCRIFPASAPLLQSRHVPGQSIQSRESFSLTAAITLASSQWASAFEGQIGADLVRGTETTALLYIKVTGSHWPHPVNIVELKSSAVTLLFPHNCSFV